MTGPEVFATMHAVEQGDTAESHVVVGKARAAGIGPSLNDDELFRALQAVHLAKANERERVLFDGPLWLSIAAKGMGAAAALTEILSYFGVHPTH